MQVELSRTSQLQKVIWNATTSDGNLYINQNFDKNCGKWINSFSYLLKDEEGEEIEIPSQEIVNAHFSKEGAYEAAEEYASFGYNTRVCKISRYITSESYSILEIVKVVKAKEVDRF